MAEYKFQNVNSSVIRNTANQGTPLTSAYYDHDDNSIYYIFSNGTNNSVNLKKIDANGITTQIAELNIGFSVPMTNYISYGYDNGGTKEIHFINPIRTDLWKIQAQQIKYIPSTNTASVVTNSSHPLYDAVYGVQDYTTLTSTRNIYYVYVGTDLWCVQTAYTTDSIKFYKYNPSTMGWFSSYNKTLANINTASHRMTVFSYNDKIVSIIRNIGNTDSYFSEFNTSDFSYANNDLKFYTLDGQFASMAPISRFYATPVKMKINGNDKIILLGGTDSGWTAPATNAVEFDITTKKFSVSSIVNQVNFSTLSNALDVGGYIIFVGYYASGITDNVIKFTKVLNDVTGFTASYVPAYNSNPNSIVLNWNDSTEESMYVIEKSVNGGSWVTLTTIPQNITTYTDSDNINITTNRYSYRIKAAEVVVA